MDSEVIFYKMLYLVSMNVKKKWGTPRSWKQVLNVLSIKYRDRLGLE